MPYTKTTWVDASTPAIDASHLNKIEEGIRVAQLTAESATPGSTAATAVHVVTGFTFADIQTQINTAAAAGGGTVALPEGVYSGNARIELKDNVVIRGAGQGATVLRGLSGVAGGVITALSADTVVDAVVQDLTVDANVLAGVNGIQISTGSRVTVSRVTVTNGTIGIWLNGSADCKVIDCLVSSSSTRGIETSSVRTLVRGCNIDTALDTGITVTGATDCRVESTRVAAVGSTGANKHGINIVAGSDRAQVAGCPRIAATGGMGVHVDASVGVEITGNVIDQSSATLEGIGLSATATDARVVGNRVINGKDNGISVSGARSIVTSNVVDGAQFMGIQVNANDCVVNSNVIRNAGKSAGVSAWAGVDLNNAQHCIVIGNRCFDDQGTPTQKYGIGERGTSDNNTIGGNDLAGNATAQTSLIGANTVLLANQRTPTRNQAAPYTVSRNDEAYQLRLTAAGTVTIPDAATLPNGFSVGFYQAVTGTVTITNAVAGQLKSRGTVFNLAGQYGVAWVTKDASGDLVLAGDLA
jgi:parallel beta-helix repeat protein